LNRILAGASVSFILLFAFSASADEAQCRANATDEGSFFSSRTYTAQDEFPDATPLETFKRLDIFVLRDGWRVNQADKDIGTISASKDVAGSEGKQTNLSIVVESLGAKGSKATVTFQIGFGQVVVGSDVAESLCGMLSGSAKPGQ
jgi:hypothetical protein